MTWPFENDTSAITKKLAKRNLKADKSRNILIIITIALGQLIHFLSFPWCRVLLAVKPFVTFRNASVIRFIFVCN